MAPQGSQSILGGGGSVVVVLDEVVGAGTVLVVLEVVWKVSSVAALGEMAPSSVQAVASRQRANRATGSRFQNRSRSTF